MPLIAILTLFVAAAACGDGDGDRAGTTEPPAATSSPSSSASDGPVRLRLEEVASIDAPVAMASRGEDLWIADQGGRVFVLRGGAGPPRLALDISDRTEALGEQGLLGLAVSPDGRYLYLDYTDLEGDTNVDEFAFDGSNVDAGSRRRLLFVDQPFANHNGGQLAFGPDGHLYIGLGDGGSGGDPMDNGQSLRTLLGKILRIDPRPSGGRPYGIPPDNPFVGRQGARPEIWAYGLRNPWRFSFDRDTGELWIADVGQGEWEEVDRQPADSTGGENYGWSRMEGTHPFASLGGSGKPAGAIDPVFEYDHDGGRCSITGGFVYRGSDIPSLTGTYVFTDYCAGPIMGLAVDPSRVGQARSLELELSSVASFGEDMDGELYVLALGDGVYRIEAET